jgi:hypothetical protein
MIPLTAERHVHGKPMFKGATPERANNDIQEQQLVLETMSSWASNSLDQNHGEITTSHSKTPL